MAREEIPWIPLILMIFYPFIANIWAVLIPSLNGSTIDDND